MLKFLIERISRFARLCVWAATRPNFIW
jgi:F-type H+/Na+-transporting ATPase subunit alpha